MNEMTQKSQTLTEYYRSLPRAVPPKKSFLSRVSQRCGVEPYTVELWVAGKSRPSKDEYLNVLSQETGIPKDQLFAE